MLSSRILSLKNKYTCEEENISFTFANNKYIYEQCFLSMTIFSFVNEYKITHSVDKNYLPASPQKSSNYKETRPFHNNNIW